MYIPNSFAERDLPTLFAFIEEHPLGALVTSSAPDGLFATHLPLVLDRSAGPRGTLFGHVARANPHSRVVTEGSVQALVIFTGPDTYITPNWYVSKEQTGRVVPTWNYVAVHATGTLRLRGDQPFLRDHLDALTRQHEGGGPNAWHPSDAPAEFIDQQMKAIIGVEITIERLEGKWKMSQNRSAADVEGVVHGLEASGTPENQAVATIVRARRSAER